MVVVSVVIVIVAALVLIVFWASLAVAWRRSLLPLLGVARCRLFWASLAVAQKKEWLDLCGAERVYVFMFPRHNIYNGGGTLYIFMSLCWKNIK